MRWKGFPVTGAEKVSPSLVVSSSSDGETFCFSNSDGETLSQKGFPVSAAEAKGVPVTTTTNDGEKVSPSLMM